MKRSLLFALIHILALILAYSALGIVLYGWFKVALPLLPDIKNSNYLAAGTFFLLPVLGFVCIKYSNSIVQRALGYLYIILWVLVIIRFLRIILSK